LKDRLPTDKQADFIEQYEKIKSGEHTLKAGKVYDAVHDSIITLDPMTGRATAVHDWDGTKWSAEQVKDTYPDRLTFNFTDMVAVGDGWWLSPVLAGHLGIDPEEGYEAYLDTMKYMATDDFRFLKATGLKEALLELSKTTPTVLVTNSKQDDADRLLKSLDLETVFTDTIYSAGKPSRTKEIFHTLLERYEANPEKTVAVGDNFINEIAPALSLGMKAIHITPYGYGNNDEHLKVVRSLEEVL
jgi:putative hydrolase of the HAD superfamily